MTFEELLRMQVKGVSPVSGEEVKYSPEFRIAVQSLDAEFNGISGVHVIVHANGHDSDTVDLLVAGNKSYKLY